MPYRSSARGELVAIPTKNEARGILGPYHGLISRIVREAWDEWRMVHGFRTSVGLPPPLYHRTIVNDVFDGIARRAILLFGIEPRVSVEQEAQTFKLFFRSRLLVRFKKGGDDKLGSDVPTQTAMAFMRAEGVPPNMPPETAKVEITWLPNDIWTKVDKVLVVARDGDRLIWDYEIDEAAEAGDVVPMPLPPTGPPEPPSGDDLVTPKARPGGKPAKK